MRSIIFNNKRVLYTFCSIALIIILLLITQVEFIDTVSPKREKIVDVIYANGYIESIRSVNVPSRVNGVIVELFVNEGDLVKVGDPIFTVDDYHAQQEYNRAKSNLEFWEDKIKSVEEIHKKGFYSDIDYKEVTANYKKADADFQYQKRQLKETAIRAPIDAQILSTLKKVGDFAGTSEVVAKIGDVKKRVIAKVDEEDILDVSIGQKTLILPENSKSDVVETKITRVLPEGDPEEQKFQIYIDLPNDKKFMNGMNVRVNIIRREMENVLVLPNEAIFGNKVQVYKSGKLELKSIKTGVSNKKFTEILEGLNDDEKVKTPFNPKINYESFFYATDSSQ